MVKGSKAGGGSVMLGTTLLTQIDSGPVGFTCGKVAEDPVQLLWQNKPTFVGVWHRKVAAQLQTRSFLFAVLTPYLIPSNLRHPRLDSTQMQTS